MIVEDEAIIAADLKVRLEDLGYQVCAQAASGQEAIDKAQQERPDLILMDIVLKGRMSGITAADWIRSNLNIPVVFVTAYAEEERLERAKLTLPFGYILKPFQDRDIRVAVDMALYTAQVDAERRRAEEALRESEEQFRLVVQNANESICVIQDETYKYVNDYGLQLFGTTREKILGARILEVVHPDDRDMILDRIRRRLAGEEVNDVVEHRLIDAKGRFKWVETRGVLTQWEGRPASIAFASDITDRKLAQEALQRSEEHLRSLVDSSGDAIISLDIEHRFTSGNPAFVALFGYDLEEVLGRPSALIHASPEESVRFANLVYPIVQEAGSWRGEWIYRRKDGGTLPMETVMSAQRTADQTISGYVAVMRDITERRQAEKEKERLEAQLRQAHKMEAIGTMAGGIAHDFNNILAAILGYTELALADTPREHPVSQSLEQVLKASLRAKSLVQQILSFSRRAEQTKSRIQVTPVVKEALKLLRATLPTTIEIRQELDSEAGFVLADPSDIHQLLMNLCANAEYAMREKGGLLKVTLSRVELDESSAARYPGLGPGSYLQLTVSDTGSGIKPEILERIFEPFFTTKGPGEGTGMGLSVAHGIVKSHGGAITAYSEPGQGSTFRVYLPVLEAGQEAQRLPESEPLPGGSERILLVDDEPALAELGRQLLERLGYRVTSLASSQEALETFKADPQGFDLLITDQTMPRMTGAELAGKILAIRPDIPVILCTGFSAQISDEKAQEIGIRRLLMKPLDARQTARAIREVLGG